MQHNKIFTILFFFFSCSLFAQHQNVPPQIAPIIDKTVQKYNALSTFSIDFKMNMEKNNKKIQNFEGILFVKKEKYFLTFEDQIIANDGEVMWNYQKSINEISLFEAEDDDFTLFHPAKMLINWSKEFDAKFIRDEEYQSKPAILVDLTPKKQSSFYKIRLFINKNTSYIQKMVMYEMDESIITYTITKFTPNTEVADTKFSFNKNDYPNVQINDMR